MGSDSADCQVYLYYSGIYSADKQAGRKNNKTESTRKQNFNVGNPNWEKPRESTDSELFHYTKKGYKERLRGNDLELFLCPLMTVTIETTFCVSLCLTLSLCVSFSHCTIAAHTIITTSQIMIALSYIYTYITVRII